eukprot:4011430-Pleurochrysis_carterae.AAC.2
MVKAGQGLETRRFKTAAAQLLEDASKQWGVSQRKQGLKPGITGLDWDSQAEPPARPHCRRRPETKEAKHSATSAIEQRSHGPYGPSSAVAEIPARLSLDGVPLAPGAAGAVH